MQAFKCDMCMELYYLPTKPRESGLTLFRVLSNKTTVQADICEVCNLKFSEWQYGNCKRV